MNYLHLIRKVFSFVLLLSIMPKPLDCVFYVIAEPTGEARQRRNIAKQIW